MNGRSLQTLLSLLMLAMAWSGCGPGSPEWTGHRQPLADAPLPNWATPAERELQALAERPSALRGRFPPPNGYRVPAEYEPTAAVVMTWAGYTNMLGDIAPEVADAGAEVWVVGGPANLTGVPADQYRRLNLAYDSVWSRDYGPVGIHEQTGELGVIDTTYRHWASRQNDDALPCQIAQEAQAACYETELILDGGNYMTDGQGSVFVTQRLYEWNDHLTEAEVDALLADYLGAERIHVFDYAQDAWGYPADGTGHIDMFAKLLDDCKVLVAQTDEDPFQAPLDQAAATFAGLACAPGQTYQVHRVPAWSEWGTWYTYTNALIVNDTVILPGYAGGDDANARQIVQAALPGHRVVNVNSDSSIMAGGSIHCVTRELPAAVQPGCATPADCDLANVGQHACVDGLCQILSCQVDWADCDGAAPNGCETLLGTIDDCSACADGCYFSHAQAACTAGACELAACNAGWASCDGQDATGCEVRLGGVDNCAACADACAFDHAQAACQAGECVLSECDPGWDDCDGEAGTGCETPLGTLDDCGGCADTCAFDRAQGTCTGGACNRGACDPGWDDCDADDGTGCETPLGTDFDCAACADACGQGSVCRDGICQMEDCPPGMADCNGQPADGCEQALDVQDHCGACGAACQAPATCTDVGAGHACTCPDEDADGAFDARCGGIDCDDDDPTIHPGAEEACNELDDDCDGLTDEYPSCDPPPDTPKGSKGCGCVQTRAGGTPLAGLLLVLGLLFRRRP